MRSVLSISTLSIRVISGRLLLAALFTFSFSSQALAISDQLYEISGAEVLASNITAQVQRAVDVKRGRLPGKSLAMLFRAQLAERVSAATASAAQRWFSSADAEYLRSVERAAAARANVQELRSLMETLKGAPPADDRDLLQRMRSTTRALDINLMIARYGYAAVILGTSDLDPAAALQQAANDLAPSEQFQRDQLRATSVYVYGDADQDSLTAYVNWAESELGVAWFSALHDSLDAALKTWLGV